MGVEKQMIYIDGTEGGGINTTRVIKPSFIARYLILDNMRGRDVRVYLGERIAIATNETPFDLVRPDEFKIIVLPAGTTNVTLAYSSLAPTVAGYLKYVLTNDTAELYAFHQTSYLGVNALPAIGNPDDAMIGAYEYLLPASVIALLKRIKTAHYTSDSTADSAASVANTTVVLAPTGGDSRELVKLHSLHMGYTGALPAAPILATVTLGTKTMRYAVGANGVTHNYGNPGLVGTDGQVLTITLPAGGAGAIGVITAHYEIFVPVV